MSMDNGMSILDKTRSRGLYSAEDHSDRHLTFIFVF